MPNLANDWWNATLTSDIFQKLQVDVIIELLWIMIKLFQTQCEHPSHKGMNRQ